MAGDKAPGLAFWAGGVMDDQLNAAIGKDGFRVRFRDAIEGPRAFDPGGEMGGRRLLTVS